MAYWLWLVLGVVLAIGEVIANFFVLIWLGVAAAIVGAIVWLAPDLSLTWQILIFAALGVALAVPGWRLGGRLRRGGPAVNINDRARQNLGRTLVLSEPIVAGRGRVFIGDTLWHLEGPDAPQGASVKVIGSRGSVLIVEAAK